ncbi:MAG: TlpA family protein disulfide reductase [Candidatus Omnitrophica bacterium]|nr:TlpA family protein disulfide reductase [Candidatus Omnitrophota bacterium]
MKNMTIIALIVLAALFLSPLQASGQVFFMGNPNVGKEAEDFTVKSLTGEETSLNEFRSGQKTIVFFWSTWCSHCRGALSNLEKKKKELKGQNIKVMVIDVGESKEVVSQYLERSKIEREVFLDEDAEVSNLYGVLGIPTFYFIGEDGIVRKVRNSFPQDLEGSFYGK